MAKSRSLAILLLGLGCLFLIDCKTAGTPKQAGDTSTKSLAAAGAQEPPPADSASPKRTASRSKDARSVPSAKENPGKAVARPRRPFLAILRKPIPTPRAILYATLAVILLVVIGAITAERVGRHRKLAPSPARH